MAKVFQNIYDVIGNTPMLELHRICDHFGIDGTIYAKLEYLNPGFSKKDRPALEIILEAERDGALKPGQPVVELTSGTMGTGLALVCAAKGYPFIAVMSAGNSIERARMMRALGAEVVIVAQSPGAVKGEVSGEDLALVEAEACRIVEQRGAFRADQFKLPGSIHAHYHTANEMIEQTGGDIDFFVDTLGSAGTFTGCAEILKNHNPAIRCYAIEPAAAAIYAEKPPQNNARHKIQGCGYNMLLPKLNTSLVDGYVQVGDEECIETVRLLARLEGAFVGFSAGANVCAALKLLRGEQKGKRGVLTLNDSGLKYLSTDLFEA